MKLNAHQLLQKGIDAWKEGNFKDAEISFKKTIELKPDFFEAHNNLGVLLQSFDRLEDAIISFKKAIRLKSDYVEAYNNLGITEKKIGRFEEAKKCFIQATKLNPKHISAHHNLGVILEELKKYEEAQDSYSKAIELNPGHEAALINRGQILFDKKEYELSLRDFDSCKNLISKTRALASLYALGRIDEIYKRINEDSKLDYENLHVAAFSSFIVAKKKKNTLNKFCDEPLNFIYFSNLLSHLNDSDSFINEVVDELEKIKLEWEPSNKTTHKGFQSTFNLFKNPSQKISDLESIIIKELDSYYSKFKNDSCSLIKRWPLKKNLEGWHVVLKQQGFQSAHIHPKGWLSGVIYLKVVPSLNKNEGAIEFSLNGLNYFDINTPKKIYQPHVGDIILFPSSLHHRTIPFSTNIDRIVVSFDLLPNT
jgi:uncharacterized protein (TIGR02466 family)